MQFRCINFSNYSDFFLVFDIYWLSYNVITWLYLFSWAGAISFDSEIHAITTLKASIALIIPNVVIATLKPVCSLSDSVKLTSTS